MELFADHRQSEQPEADDASKRSEQALLPWKVLLIDDDEQMHQVTMLALSDFEFEGRKLEVISAYSGDEAKAIYSARQYCIGF